MKVIEPTLEERIDPPEPGPKQHVSQVLDRYGIPFFYHHPLLVVKQEQRCIEYADFFLPTYRGLAIDYLTQPKSKIFLDKEQTYRQNRIPAILLTPQDLTRPNWQGRLYGAIQSLGHRSRYGRPRRYG